MTLGQYNKAKYKIYDIWYEKHPTEQIAKYLNLIYQILREEWGFLYKNEIPIKIVNDIAIIARSKTKTKQLLRDEIK
jgi:hypothetical protein